MLWLYSIKAVKKQTTTSLLRVEDFLAIVDTVIRGERCYKIVATVSSCLEVCHGKNKSFLPYGEDGRHSKESAISNACTYFIPTYA